MRKVEKYINLYQESKITVHQAYKQLGGRKYKEFWNKLYKLSTKERNL
ncbi:hypothetical protein H5S09_03805 [Limosilactobacillus sp. STM2_1]|uniref:Uncharacterized protein n=1 Tax=Limosilactobacillus rudii TaxID=2759755 RepID=A0A7W3UK70_9LACO|nr:hypothetical protein [Limosilactobacillus rudii]MBB1079048.1 hypothetical protein [Limosilactobacillus rudii]MBB1097077.1 hypothetical protein [Limosilactobacillus rudii]MCD7134044.1 hypothetical protein [Limosilactobacillus rudii]